MSIFIVELSKRKTEKKLMLYRGNKMGLKTNQKNKTIRVGTILSLVLGLIAFIIGIFEGGLGGLIIIPFFFIGLLGSALGVIPFIGPVLYYLGVGWLFDAILKAANLNMPISTGIIFYSNLVFSALYCFVTSSLLVVFLALRKKLTVLKKIKIEEMLKNLGKKDKDKAT